MYDEKYTEVKTTVTAGIAAIMGIKMCGITAVRIVCTR